MFFPIFQSQNVHLETGLSYVILLTNTVALAELNSPSRQFSYRSEHSNQYFMSLAWWGGGERVNQVGPSNR